MINRTTLESALETGTPWIESDSTAVFVYQGNAEKVRVAGDMTQWADEIELERFADTELFFARVELPPNARIEYMLAVDRGEFGPDPACPFRVLNGLGAHSELVMPAYDYPAVFASVRNGITGSFDRVREFLIDGGPLGYEKQIHVYLPPNYDESGDSHYSTVFILDGSDYIEFAHTPAVLDHLILEEAIEPLIAVFVSPPNRHLPDPPNRVTEYGLNPVYADWMANTLAPWLDARFRTIRDPGYRLVAGDSYAGVGSLFIAFEQPETFGLAYSQSGYLPLEKGRMMRAFAGEPRKPIRLYVDVGIYERMVGKDWLPNDEIDFTDGNRKFVEILEDKGYDFVYAEYAEGHTWGNWRVHLIDALKHFFPRS
jgi:enterochelin esterase family protein